MIGTPDFTPFSLYIQAANATDHTLGPRFIRVHIDADFLAMLARRHEFCRAEKVSEIIDETAPRDWDKATHKPEGTFDPRAPVTAEVHHWRLKVDATEFTFLGSHRGESLTDSIGVPTACLIAWLVNDPTPPKVDIGRAHRFRRVGTMALHTHNGSVRDVDDLAEYPDAMQAFVETLKSACPEIAAAIVEEDMARRIASVRSSGHGMPTADVGNTARRDRRI